MITDTNANGTEIIDTIMTIANGKEITDTNANGKEIIETIVNGKEITDTNVNGKEVTDTNDSEMSLVGYIHCRAFQRN